MLATLVLFGSQFALAEGAFGQTRNSVPGIDEFAPFVREASRRFGISESWIRAVMGAESLGKVRAVSPKDAMGLMQIMPKTWADLRARYDLGTDPFDPHDNILAGAAYLKELHDQYGDAGFIAAYNAGPTRYEANLSTGRPLPAETRAYAELVSRAIIGEAAGGARAVAIAGTSWTSAPLFAVGSSRDPGTSQSALTMPSVRRPESGAAVDLTGLSPKSAGLFVVSPNEISGQ